MFSYGRCQGYHIRCFRCLPKLIRRRKIHQIVEFLCLLIGISFIINILPITDLFQSSTSSKSQQSIISSISEDYENDTLSTIERSTRALEKLKKLLASVMSSNDQPWIWIPTEQYPSVPYQPTVT
ncbi:unnamed protein product, partial [Rotaria sp. Silwood2]